MFTVNFLLDLPCDSSELFNRKRANQDRSCKTLSEWWLRFGKSSLRALMFFFGFSSDFQIFGIFCQKGGDLVRESELESGEEESESEELSMSGIESFILLDPKECKVKILTKLFQFFGKSIVFVSFLLFDRWRKLSIAICPTP